MSSNEIRVVLIGKTGNGKSSTGNSLLHSRSAFHAKQSGAAITKDCLAGRYQYSDNGQSKSLTVVDTPGFFDTDTSVTNESVEKKISSQIFNMTAPGVHAFLIVIRVSRFTPEEKNTVDFIRNIFGRDAVKYCVVVLTGEDQLDEGQTVEEFVNSSQGLRDLIRACGNRIFAMNNKLNGQPLENKTRRLLKIIENMVRMNNGTYYTNDEYQRIERQRQEEKRRQEEAARQKKKAEEDAIREEERKKNEQTVEKVRREEQQKAEQRQAELQRELDSARRSGRNQNDFDVGSLMRMFQPFGMGNAMPCHRGAAVCVQRLPHQ